MTMITILVLAEAVVFATVKDNMSSSQEIKPKQ